MACSVLATSATTVPLSPVPADQALAGSPVAGALDLAPECGLWEHSVGSSTDVEVDEIFVVLAGRARIDIEGEGALSVGPGDVVRLTAGARTTWHVTEPLRKFWVTPS